MIGILLKQRIVVAVLFSLGAHALVLFGIGFAYPGLFKAVSMPLQPLEVVLVNSKSRMRPSKADKMAQNNLDGGGNTADEHHAKTPLPTLGDGEQFSPEQSVHRVQQLEQEAKRLLTQLQSNYSVAQEKTDKQPVSNEASGEDLVQRSLEIARLEAQISKSMDYYEKLPTRKFIGARTQEYRYAQYVEDWRGKVERVGNLNYPQQARDQKIYGKLTLTVSIRADGSVESVEINRSSGQRILDAAAMRIVKLAAPYAVFPPDIRRETDILSITRTWTFTSNDHLESE
ncbi:MAG: energy transducer TonB [Gallionellaceae bacterium]|nr:MAG: energy transducer TonB [Gallionellaceae bacterium]